MGLKKDAQKGAQLFIVLRDISMDITGFTLVKERI